jgi:hypothetical protein
VLFGIRSKSRLLLNIALEVLARAILEEEEGEGKGEGEEKWKVVSDVGRSEFPRQDSMTGPSGSYNNQVLRGKGAASFY